jgi:hypothetical protein
MTKPNRQLVIALATLLLASLACNTIMGGSTRPTELPVDIQPTEESPIIDVEPTVEQPLDTPTKPPIGGGDTSGGDTTGGGGGNPSSEWPLPGNITNFVEAAGVTNFQTDMPFDDVVKFYQDEFASAGYTERDLLHTVTSGVFSMVFDGHPSGQQIAVQGVDLGDGTVNVNISLQTIP